jgi:hypothetical protein
MHREMQGDDMTEEKKPLQARWKAGQSGNPAGKKKGTRNKATLLALAVLEKDVKAIAQVITEAALRGDMQAARMVIERLIPLIRERPISVDLPDTSTIEGVAQAQAAILQAVATGELLPSEGATLAGIAEARRKALETQELEARIAALEVGDVS